RERFNTGLRRVFIDNYAAVPPESIRRVLALRAAGVIDVLAMGQAYQMDIGDHGTVIKTAEGEHRFQVFIDARGQKALDLTDLPFPRLRDQLLAHSDELPPVGDNYTLMVPEIGGHRIALAALPFLMHDRPFVQGIAVCAEIGATIGGSIHRAAQRRRPWLAGYDDEH
ncbi:MAG TPA: FAD-NAD(P)-binding protein, partial [Alcanivorax sp.]|nr:FAD-NAD(P)-binding protein [Alcanivorax sp.]